MSSSSTGPVEGAQEGGERVARSSGFEWLARAGLVARGVVYAIIGVLAVKLALRDGGETTDQQGALKEIAGQPFGKTLLVLMAVGLGGYALWRLLRAALGHGTEESDDAKARIGGAASGIGYAFLCVTAVKIVSGASTGSGSPEKTTGGVLAWTGGPILVAVAGAVLIAVAADEAHKGLARRFLKKSRTGRMSRGATRTFTALGVFGHLARAVVFALMGYGLVKAAVSYDADEAIGLDGALAQLSTASYGPWLLGAVAVGLLGFAAYSIADARYRKV
ncbi:DUF1206 domain-containing protein [Patulibacter sp.]|uniref:DUF1206 domain-containing protein n=1 Tax=Patulibacter sp. TaxID=1912859 RepID=UPI0027204FA8|nr:DUF1206 domain-containing protein [Patulibacter sp.]MDO9410474.1 DUF1206 domain-containing protein [Patulibacter sp.]